MAEYSFRFCQISIHAPTQGATQKTNATNTTKLFQSTLPRKERPRLYENPWAGFKFQSTLPRKERQAINYGCQFIALFQSTLPRKERPIGLAISSPLLKFQSTLPRKERLPRRLKLTYLKGISIHAPTQGATIPKHRTTTNDRISIHAPTQGATDRL